MAGLAVTMMLLEVGREVGFYVHVNDMVDYAKIREVTFGDGQRRLSLRTGPGGVVVVGVLSAPCMWKCTAWGSLL